MQHDCSHFVYYPRVTSFNALKQSTGINLCTSNYFL